MSRPPEWDENDYVKGYYDGYMACKDEALRRLRRYTIATSPPVGVVGTPPANCLSVERLCSGVQASTGSERPEESEK